MTDMQTRIARAWATIDGNVEDFDARINGRYDGYMSEAEELIVLADLSPAAVTVKPLEWEPWSQGKILLTWCHAYAMQKVTTPIGTFTLCRREPDECNLPAGWFIDKLEEKVGIHKDDVAAKRAFWDYYKGLFLAGISLTPAPVAEPDAVQEAARVLLSAIANGDIMHFGDIRNFEAALRALSGEDNG